MFIYPAQPVGAEPQVLALVTEDAQNVGGRQEGKLWSAQL